MADISRIQLPSGNVYDLKDALARQLIAQGVAFVLAWDGNSAPVVANIPAGVQVTYENQIYTGTLAASSETSGKFYLVKSTTQSGEIEMDVFDEYVVVIGGTSQSPTYSWEKIGDTQISIGNLGALAYKNTVTLNKGDGDNVLGENTTFTVSVPVYSATTTNIKATASDIAVGASSTDSFVKSYPGVTSKLATTTIKGVAGTDSATLVENKTTKKMVTTTITGVSGTANVSEVSHTSKKLVTTSIPNVTSAGTASTWGFAMGSGNDSETLIISGGNSTAPTLGTAITAATGSLTETTTTENVGATLVETVSETSKTVATADASATTVATGSLTDSQGANTGDSLIASFDTTSKTLATANADATTVATGSLSSDGTGGSVMTGLGTATTASAVTGVAVTQQPTIALETGAAAGTGVISVATDVATSANTENVTVGTNDKVKVAKYDDLGVTVS